MNGIKFLIGISVIMLGFLGSKKPDYGSFCTSITQEKVEEVAYFASGCFWCVEGVYEKVYGVTEVVSGYAGGTVANPSYYDHGNHAETVAVVYDPKLVSYADLVQVFFDITNPIPWGKPLILGSRIVPLYFQKTKNRWKS